MIYIDNGTFITKYEILNPEIEDSIETILKSMSEDIRSERYFKDDVNLKLEQITPKEKFDALVPEKFSELISNAMTERTKL